MPADERREIEAAMDRLLNGTPLRSDGKLTIMSLAAEAGVKRHARRHLGLIAEAVLAERAAMRAAVASAMARPAPTRSPIPCQVSVLKY
jgi:hypothetical protein